MKEAQRVVYSIINCDKPIVSAINGAAGGAGLAAALLADISVAGKSVTLTDAHIRFGVAAGDHAAMVWPLLCGLAKAKYHILTSTPITGAEAERIGLVSLAVDESKVLDVALDIASGLARGPQHALRWTKRVLNHWLRDAAPIFEASMAYEAIGFFGGIMSRRLRPSATTAPQLSQAPSAGEPRPSTTAAKVWSKAPWLFSGGHAGVDGAVPGTQAREAPYTGIPSAAAS